MQGAATGGRVFICMCTYWACRLLCAKCTKHPPSRLYRPRPRVGGAALGLPLLLYRLGCSSGTLPCTCTAPMQAAGSLHRPLRVQSPVAAASGLPGAFQFFGTAGAAG